MYDLPRFIPDYSPYSSYRPRAYSRGQLHTVDIMFAVPLARIESLRTICRNLVPAIIPRRIDSTPYITGDRPLRPAIFPQASRYKDVQSTQGAVRIGAEIQRLHIGMQERRALHTRSIDSRTDRERLSPMPHTVTQGHVDIQRRSLIVVRRGIGSKQQRPSIATQHSIRLPRTNLQGFRQVQRTTPAIRRLLRHHQFPIGKHQHRCTIHRQRSWCLMLRGRRKRIDPLRRIPSSCLILTRPVYIFATAGMRSTTHKIKRPSVSRNGRRILFVIRRIDSMRERYWLYIRIFYGQYPQEFPICRIVTEILPPLFCLGQCFLPTGCIDVGLQLLHQKAIPVLRRHGHFLRTRRRHHVRYTDKSHEQ